jgi:hypothetical protein
MKSVFKKWEDQGELKNLIKKTIGEEREGIELSDIVVHKTFNVGLENAEATHIVHKAIDELRKDWLICTNPRNSQDKFYQVTECAQPSVLIEATGQKDYPGALLFLLNKGVWHPDMERHGLIDNSESNDTVSEDKPKSRDKEEKMSSSKKVIGVKGAQSDESNFDALPEDSEQVKSAVDAAKESMFDTPEMEFSLDQINENLETISPAKMAEEIGKWVTDNVEQFIDNRETVFRMYLTINADMGMPNSSLYQRTYMSVPDPDEDNGITPDMISQVYETLDAKLAEAKEILDGNQEFHDLLFNRMSYFYELTGFAVKDGKVQQAMIQKMVGKVSLNELMFDPVSMTVSVAQGVGKNEDGKVTEGDKKVVVKEQELPAGFGIEVEISMKPKNRAPTAMY